jgi:23S rRNA (adenine2030-N6)-methyltransferase
MNYRHAYHAGNFADVLKHAVLARVLDYMKRKAAPLRVVDTHAGAGRYQLSSVQAGKTNEWRAGIGRLLGPDADPLSVDAERLLAPYLEAVRADNGGEQLRFYPGSPRLALRLMRPQDVLVANELHPEDGIVLKAAVGGDRRARTMALDGWTALRSLLPPKERRGLILIDPPFEQQGEFERLVQGIADGLERFATGTFLAWYPIKDVQAVTRFCAALALTGPTDKMLRIEMMVRRAGDTARLNGCGLIVVNPPFTLQAEMAALMPELTRRLAEDEGASYRLEHLGGAAGTGRGAAKRVPPSRKSR